MYGLTKAEIAKLKNLRTPIMIQDFLDRIPLNWEKNGETYMSVHRSLKARKAHCFEGALIAAAALKLAGQKPLLFDLKADGDDDHVVALYKKNGYWGSISKTNHATLRFRDPIYKTLRELALSYFHEYTSDKTGKKVLRWYSAKPFDLSRFGTMWLIGDDDLDTIAEAMDEAPHSAIVPKRNKKYLRPADKMERRAGTLREWQKKNPHT